MRRWLGLGVLAVLLGGCVNQLAVREAQLAPWIGRSEAQLVQSIGVPDKTYAVDDTKYLAYTEGRVEVIPSPPMWGPPFWGYGAAFPPQTLTLVCETTFAVKQGVVVSYALRGNGCG